MAFTRTPDTNTYQTIPLKFDGFPTYRSGDLSIQRDCNIVNLYYDRISQENKTREVYLKKRPGLRATAYNLNKNLPTDAMRGYYYDTASNRLYWAVNNKVYSVTPDSGTSIRTVATLATSSGYVGFCEFLQTSTSTRFILVSDGTDLWVDNYAANSCAKVTDADMPTPHVPQPRVLNGYAVLADLNTGDIYNSDNDDPTSWVAGDYITAEMSGDYVIQLAQNRNYIVAFGTNSVEFFWDAANASGSPFKRNDSGYRDIGYVTGLKQIGNILYFVGQDKDKNLAVYLIDGFTLTQISNPVVERALQNITSTDNVKSQVTLNRDGYSISVDGHTFYALETEQATWLYEINDKIWYEWRNSSNTKLNIEAAWSMFNGAQYVAINGQTYISMLAPTVYQDFGVNYPCIYTTERFNVDSMNKKSMSRLIMMSDAYQTTGTSNMSLTWSDDDWATTSGTRLINIFNSRPMAHQFGQFITRSFRLTYSDNYPLRLRGFEFEINIGVN